MLYLHGLWYPQHQFLRSHFTSLLLNNIMFPLMACNPQVHGVFIWTSMAFNVIIGRFSNNLLHSKLNTVTFICIPMHFLHHVCRGTLRWPPRNDFRDPVNWSRSQITPQPFFQNIDKKLLSNSGAFSEKLCYAEFRDFFKKDVFTQVPCPVIPRQFKVERLWKFERIIPWMSEGTGTW